MRDVFYSSVKNTALFNAAGGYNWQLINAVDVAPSTGQASDFGINSISVQVRCTPGGAAKTSPYADCLEMVLMPACSPGVATDTADIDPGFHGHATAWVWGNGFIANTNPPTSGVYHHVMQCVGPIAPRWELWGRVPMNVGEGATLSVKAQLIGRCNTEGPCIDRINPMFTIPPYIPNVKGTAFTAFPNIAGQVPARQNSLSPRMWRGPKFDVLLDAPLTACLHDIGGGPWYKTTLLYVPAGGAGGTMSGYLLSEEAVPNYYQVQGVGAAVAAATQTAFPQCYQYTSAYRDVGTFNKSRVYLTTAGVADQTITTQIACVWPN